MLPASSSSLRLEFETPTVNIISRIEVFDRSLVANDVTCVGGRHVTGEVHEGGRRFVPEVMSAAEHEAVLNRGPKGRVQELS